MYGTQRAHLRGPGHGPGSAAHLMHLAQGVGCARAEHNAHTCTDRDTDPGQQHFDCTSVHNDAHFRRLYEKEHYSLATRQAFHGNARFKWTESGQETRSAPIEEH